MVDIKMKDCYELYQHNLVLHTTHSFNVLQILTHIYLNHQLEETIHLHTDRNTSIRRWNCIN